jgi:hypothetical protein
MDIAEFALLLLAGILGGLRNARERPFSRNENSRGSQKPKAAPLPREGQAPLNFFPLAVSRAGKQESIKLQEEPAEGPRAVPTRQIGSGRHLLCSATTCERGRLPS